ncbi:MAG: hypothetical protein LC749_14395 [Actinobacteria bacterium]|nr:hypothetical protein [Actinomycetota bacterium]
MRSRKVLGNRPRMATSHHQLGMIAQYRGRCDDAEDWYHKSLTINAGLGDQLARTIWVSAWTCSSRHTSTPAPSGARR